MSELEKSEFDRIWPRIQISKLETARRQLNAAIRSYFLDNDPVPTLTLVGAAYQIVKDLAGATTKGSFSITAKRLAMAFIMRSGIPISL